MHNVRVADAKIKIGHQPLSDKKLSRNTLRVVSYPFPRFRFSSDMEEGVPFYVVALIADRIHDAQTYGRLARTCNTNMRLLQGAMRKKALARPPTRQIERAMVGERKTAP